MEKKLTNRDIAENYQWYEMWLMPSDFVGAFSYWIYSQGRDMDMNFHESIQAYRKYIDNFFNNKNLPIKFNLKKIECLVNEDVFKSIKEILILNINEDKDFIDLGALARNVKYMIARNQITQPS